MMCEAARMLLDAYLDNQLSPLQRGKVDEHLRECKACAKIVDDSRGYLVCLEAYYRFIQPSDALVESALFNLADAEIGKKRTASDLSKTGSTAAKLEAPVMERRKRGPLLAAVALVVLAGAGYGAYRLLSGPGALGRVDAATGAVERRGSATPAFAPAPAGTELAAGDVVRTPAGGSASLSTEPARIALGPSSSLALRGEAADGRFEIGVEQGTATIEAIRGDNRVVVVTAAARATVHESKTHTAQLDVDARPAETVFTVGRGAFRVEGGGGEVLVPEGRRTVVKSGKAPGPPEDPGATQPPPDRTKPPTPSGGDDGAEPPIVQAARKGEAEVMAAVLASPSLGRGDLTRVQAWLEKQKRPDDVRRGAVALSAIARSVPGSAPDAVQALARIATGDASGENRAAAVEALASVPGPGAVKALETVALRDKDAAVAKRAASALALRDGREVPGSLLAVLKGAADAGVKKEAAKGAIFADPAAAAAALGADLPADLVAEADKGPAGLAAALRLTRDPAIRFQLLARAETVAAGADPADAGLKALGDELAAVAQGESDPLVLRRRAVASIGAIPKPASDAASDAATNALSAARSDRDESVKVAAALAHLRREGKDAGGTPAATLYQQLRSAEQKIELANGVARVLPADAAGPILQKIAEGERVAPLKAAVEALRRGLGAAGGDGQKPPDSGGSGGDPVAGLNDPDPAVRARSVTALSRRPLEDAAAREAIFRALEDAEETVRSAAVAAARRYKDDEAFDPLKAAFTRDASAAVRASALEAVASFTQREDLAEVLGTALGEEADEDVRTKIVQAISRVGGETATDGLVRALSQDGSPAVQSAVVRALGSRKERKAGQALVDALASTDPVVQGEVVSALRQFSGQSFAFDASGDPDAVAAELQAIREWWSANADSYP